MDSETFGGRKTCLAAIARLGSGRRLFGDWGGGEKIVAEAGGISIEQLGDTFGLRRAQDDAGVMYFGD
ncbi:MAG: hypothetical protein WBY73_08675, partial [Candidatus Acidiferrales bacterium]